MSDVDAGEHVASPTPTPSRATISCAKLRATPDTAVSRLQAKTPRGQDLPALRPVRQPAERQADDRVEQREDGAEQAERRVAEAPLAADPFADAADDLAVEEVHQVDGEEHDERVLGPAICSHSWLSLGARTWPRPTRLTCLRSRTDASPRR